MTALLFGRILGVIAVQIVLTLILAFPIEVLWNVALVPAFDGVNEIGFWQAFGLMVLIQALVNGVKVEAKA